MLFMLNTSLSLQIIALVMAAFLLAWGLHKEGGGTGVAVFIGFIATLIALFSMVSSLYLGIKLWHEDKMLQEGVHSTSLMPQPTANVSPAAISPHESKEKRK